jgi:hypothetical protein
MQQGKSELMEMVEQFCLSKAQTKTTPNKGNAKRGVSPRLKRFNISPKNNENGVSHE